MELWLDDLLDIEGEGRGGGNKHVSEKTDFLGTAQEERESLLLRSLPPWGEGYDRGHSARVACDKCSLWDLETLPWFYPLKAIGVNLFEKTSLRSEACVDQEEKKKHSR